MKIYLLYILLIPLFFTAQNKNSYQCDIRLKELKKAFYSSDTMFFKQIHDFKTVNLYKKNKLIQSNINSEFITIHNNYFLFKGKREWGKEIVFYQNNNSLFLELSDSQFYPFEALYQFDFIDRNNYRIIFKKKKKKLGIESVSNCIFRGVKSTGYTPRIPQ